MEKTAGSVWERMLESQGSLHRGKEFLFVHKHVYCMCVWKSVKDEGGADSGGCVCVFMGMITPCLHLPGCIW